MLSFHQVVKTFLVDLRLDGRAEWTLRKHLQELRRYARWLEGEVLCWEGVTPMDVRVYARTRATLGHSARGATFCSLRVFYAWAVDQGFVTVSPAAHLRTPRRPHPQPKALHPAHIRQLISYLASQTGLRARRDECLVLTALYTGLRAAELARLCWGDVDLDSGVITIHLSKWNHGRAVPVHLDLTPWLTSWQALQALGANAPVFGDTHQDSTLGRPISPARVGKIARNVARATGLPLTAHVLRHTFATWTLRRSKDLYAVSKALGHQALKQTEVYVSCDVDQLAAAVGCLPAPSAW